MSELVPLLEGRLPGWHRLWPLSSSSMFFGVLCRLKVGTRLSAVPQDSSALVYSPKAHSLLLLTWVDQVGCIMEIGTLCIIVSLVTLGLTQSFHL